MPSITCLTWSSSRRPDIYYTSRITTSSLPLTTDCRNASRWRLVHTPNTVCAVLCMCAAQAIAEQYFPRLEQPSGLLVKAVDTFGREYTFKFRFWINNQVSGRVRVWAAVGPLPAYGSTTRWVQGCGPSYIRLKEPKFPPFAASFRLGHVT